MTFVDANGLSVSWKYQKSKFENEISQWHSLSREEQSIYYEKARQERQLHMELYPGNDEHIQVQTKIAIY